MSKEDILNDLEDFIDSDWKELSQQFQDEEYRKEISEPVIPNFPSYGEFYQSLVELVTDPSIPPQMAMLIHNVTAYQDRKISKSFDNIWSLFCDPHRHKIENIRCPQCNKHQTIIFSRENFPQNIRESLDRVVVRQETVHCIKCGTGVYYVSGKLIGVFDNRRINT